MLRARRGQQRPRISRRRAAILAGDTLVPSRRNGCRVVTFPKEGHTIVEPARDFAIRQATTEWVLVVDADDIVTDELRR